MYWLIRFAPSLLRSSEHDLRGFTLCLQDLVQARLRLMMLCQGAQDFGPRALGSSKRSFARFGSMIA